MPNPARRLRWLLLVLTGFLSALALADPPARVGRLSLNEGSVLFRSDRQDAGSPATVNWPLSSGAILDTGPDGRSEAWVGSTAFRLGSGSRLEFATVDDRVVLLQLATGTLAISVRDAEQARDIEVRTPDGRIQFAGAGRYRIDVRPGRTLVVVEAGSAYAYGRGNALTVPAGRSTVLDAAGQETLYGLPARDAFDDWSSSRDAGSEAVVSRRYVSPQMTGYEELDQYGDWRSSAEYGAIWYPRAVAVGWAPYRHGRWAWVPPWGWTWVDQAPWGFAPFHYGRWLEIGGRWAWIPGSYAARPVYAPALVGWVGNPGWSASFSFGSAPAVGWFPLAPREVYVPAYRASPTYVRQVNITHVTNTVIVDRARERPESTDFHYRRRPEAVTVVPATQVREGHVIDSASLATAGRRELGRAPLPGRGPDSSWLPPTPRAARALGPGGDGFAHAAPAAPTPAGTTPAAPAAAATGAPLAAPDRRPGANREARPEIPAPALPAPTATTSAATAPTPNGDPRRWSPDRHEPSRPAAPVSAPVSAPVVTAPATPATTPAAAPPPPVNPREARARAWAERRDATQAPADARPPSAPAATEPRETRPVPAPTPGTPVDEGRHRGGEFRPFPAPANAPAAAPAPVSAPAMVRETPRPAAVEMRPPTAAPTLPPTVAPAPLPTPMRELPRPAPTELRTAAPAAAPVAQPAPLAPPRAAAPEFRRPAPEARPSPPQPGPHRQEPSKPGEQKP